MVANLQDTPEVVGRIMAKTASIRNHHDTLRAVCQCPSTVLNSSRHIKHEFGKLDVIKDLIDLVGQLELSLNESIDESQLDPTLKIMIELDDLFCTLASLSGWRGLAKLSARYKKYHNRLFHIHKRLDDCLQLLTSPKTSSSSASDSSASPPSHVKEIIPLPTLTTVVTTQRLQRALFASKLVERGLEVVPVAGKYVSAVAGVVTLLLERRTDKRKQRMVLQQIQLQLQTIVNSFIEAGVLENVKTPVKAHISKTAPERLKNKLGELNLLIEKANQLSRTSCMSDAPLSVSTMEAELSELVDRVSAFRDQIETELSLLETHTQLHTLYLSMKSMQTSMQTQLRIIIGIFFQRVNK